MVGTGDAHCGALVVSRAADGDKSGRPDGVSCYPVDPMEYQVILKTGIGQFREFESPRVLIRKKLWGLFLVHKLTCGKRESVGWRHLMQKSRSSGIAESHVR